jgi:hypothetical protein
MRSTPEAPALIQYACERCKTRFVLPPSSRGLSIAGKIRAFSMSVGRTVKFHEGLGAGYDTARRQLLAKMDDEAYQSFVQSFRFCHECRQFVCNECWSTSRRSCLTCVAKSMTGTARPRPPFAPTGPEIPRPVVAAAAPRKGRLRRDMAIVAVAIAIVLISIEGGVLLVGAAGGTGSSTPAPTDNMIAAVSPSASPSPSLVPTESPSLAPTESPSLAPTDSPSPSPSLTDSPSPSLSAAPTVAPPPPPKPVPPLNIPSFTCTYPSPTAVTCTSGATYYGTDTATWSTDDLSPATHGTRKNGHLVYSHDYGANGGLYHIIYVTVSRKGTASKSASGVVW